VNLLGRVSQLDSIKRMALRAYLDHGEFPKLQVVRKLIELKLMHPGPEFGVREGVRDAVALYERDQRRVHVLSAAQVHTALKARKDCPIL
jgi:hypothetical protein